MIFVAFLVVAVAVVEGSGTACVRGTRNGMVRMRLMRLLCGQETGDGIRSGWSSAAMHGIVYAKDDVLWYEPSLI